MFGNFKLGSNPVRVTKTVGKSSCRFFLFLVQNANIFYMFGGLH